MYVTEPAEKEHLLLLFIAILATFVGESHIARPDYFSYAKISLHELYPTRKDELILYDRKRAGSENAESTFFIVALRDETLGERGIPAYGFGYVQVEVYS